MRPLRSIRWRLLAWYGPLLSTIVIGLCLAAYHFISVREDQKINDQLRHDAAVIANALRPKNQHKTPNPPGAPGQPDDTAPQNGVIQLGSEGQQLYGGEQNLYYVIWLKNGTPVTPSPNAPPDIPRPPEGMSGPRTRGDLKEFYLSGQPGDCVLVGRSIAAEQQGLRSLAWGFGLVGGGILAAGLIGGWLIVSRALRPIASITGAAQKIAAGDLSQRIDVAETESELGELAAVLNSTFARLDAAFARQTRFTADAAHELRTPVSVILTHAQNGLSDDHLTEEQREAFEACQRSAQRMRRLIESLLQLARFDGEREAQARGRCDLAALTRETAGHLKALLAERKVSLHLDTQPVAVQGNAEQLSLVITNLISNAAQHGKAAGGEIWVTVSSQGEHALLSVRDNGSGIGAEHLPHIFERFYRVDKARTTQAGRTGLGLAISKAVVEMHAGEIRVESEPGAGTMFRVLLPKIA